MAGRYGDSLLILGISFASAWVCEGISWLLIYRTTLKESSRDLSFSKFKSGAVVAMVLVVVFGLLSSLFEGKPVAKLPFVPLNLVQALSHRGIPGDDPTDCSMVFLYTLCSLSIRSNLQKFLGFAPPRGVANAGMFPMPDTKAK